MAQVTSARVARTRTQYVLYMRCWQWQCRGVVTKLKKEGALAPKGKAKRRTPPPPLSPSFGPPLPPGFSLQPPPPPPPIRLSLALAPLGSTLVKAVPFWWLDLGLFIYIFGSAKASSRCWVHNRMSVLPPAPPPTYSGALSMGTSDNTRSSSANSIRPSTFAFTNKLVGGWGLRVGTSEGWVGEGALCCNTTPSLSLFHYYTSSCVYLANLMSPLMNTRLSMEAPAINIR